MNMLRAGNFVSRVFGATGGLGSGGGGIFGGGGGGAYASLTGAGPASGYPDVDDDESDQVYVDGFYRERQNPYWAKFKELAALVKKYRLAISIAALLTLLIVVVAVSSGRTSHDDSGGHDGHDAPEPTPGAPLPDVWSSSRLPPSIRPLSQSLDFAVSLTDFTFGGTTKIALNLTTPTHYVVVHAVDLNLSSIALTSASASRTPSRVTAHPDKEYTIIEFADALDPQDPTWELSMAYGGAISDNLKGFYKSVYRDDDGTPHHMGVTQFEASDARRAFPCFDEPAMKATFSIAITARKGLTVLSNMDVLSTDDLPAQPGSPALSKLTFRTTPVMSSYLIAWVIGELAFQETALERADSSSLKIRVYTPPQLIKTGTYGLQVIKKVIAYHEKNLAIPFPLPKMDYVAIPDFSAGAMENWGLIFSRDVDMLYDPKTSNEASKERVTDVIAHELSHQWTGNLVTMMWWDDLFLNEAFATLLEYFATDAVQPTWGFMAEMYSAEYVRGMDFDTSVYTHPIANKYNASKELEGEVGAFFDEITYQKGCAVLFQLVTLLTPQVFFPRLTQYLLTNQYSNARRSDLWNALATPTQDQGPDSFPVALPKIVEGWICSPGFPLVTVTRDDQGVQMRQARFTAWQASPPAATQDGAASDEWYTSVQYVVVDRKTGAQVRQGQLMLTPDNAMVGAEDGQPLTHVPLDSADHELKANLGQAGVFRALYPAAAYPAFLESIQKGDALQGVDVAGLVSDAFAALLSGRLPAAAALNFAAGVAAHYLETGTHELVVWEALFHGMDQLRTLSTLQDWEPAFVAWAQKTVDALGKQIGWVQDKDEDAAGSRAGATAQAHARNLLRSKTMDFGVRLGCPGILNKGADLFRRFLRTRKRHLSQSARELGGDGEAGKSNTESPWVKDGSRVEDGPRVDATLEAPSRDDSSRINGVGEPSSNEDSSLFDGTRESPSVEDKAQVNPETLSAIISAGIHQGSEADWEWALRGYSQSTFIPDALRYLFALTFSRDVGLEETLGLIFKNASAAGLVRDAERPGKHERAAAPSGPLVRSQDVISLITVASMNGPPARAYEVWLWVMDHWTVLTETPITGGEGGSFNRFAACVGRLIARINSPWLLDAVEQWVAAKEAAWKHGFRQEVLRGVERGRANVAALDQGGIAGWFQALTPAK